MNVRYPLQFDSSGGTARVADDDHIRDMIEQVLFTSPGERVNRPDFGCGLRQMMFAPLSAEIAATTQYLVQGALQQWLGDSIEIESVQVTAVDSTLRVSLSYRVRRTGERRTRQFTTGGTT
jgi:hypothetical protein